MAVGSPAIDAGNPDGATTCDVEGLPRDAQPDVGAYEYVEPQTTSLIFGARPHSMVV